MSTDLAPEPESWAHDNEHVTIVNEEADGLGLAVWDTEDGLEILEFDDDGSFVRSVPVFREYELEKLIEVLEDHRGRVEA